MGIQTILTKQGAIAFTRAMVLGKPVVIKKFRIGSLAGFTPKPIDTDVADFVYEGSQSQIKMKFGSSTAIAIVELTLDHSVGDFDIGNIMLYDDRDQPFAFGVRGSSVPKVRSQRSVLGTEMNIQFPLRILTDETPANVSVSVVDQKSLPVVATEEAVTSSLASQAEFPVYLCENFKGTNRPAILYADPARDMWWANPFFIDLASGLYGVISGGNVGDLYQAPAGKVLYGGEFKDSRLVQLTRDGGSFSETRTVESSGGSNFGE